MKNLEKLQTALRDAEIPAFLVSDLSSIFWLTGFSGSYGLAIVTSDAALLVSDSRYAIQAQEQAHGFTVRTFASPTDATDFLRIQLESLNVSRLAFDENTVTVATHRKWSEKLPGIELVPITDPIGRLRMVKTEQEVQRVRAACRLIDACLEHVLSAVRPGVSENDLLLEIEQYLRHHDSSPAFAPIVVSGPRSARPHGKPSDRRLEAGDFVTFDIGATVEGYFSDLTRTIVVAAASERHQEVYAQVLKAQQAAIEAMQPGANGRDVDVLVRRILDEKDLSRYFGHGLGHGLGALVHDTGRLSSSVDVTIEPGQIWTIEPGVYIEGWGGVRIEDDILITETGPEILTHFTKELLVLPEAT